VDVVERSRGQLQSWGIQGWRVELLQLVAEHFLRCFEKGVEEGGSNSGRFPLRFWILVRKIMFAGVHQSAIRCD